MDIDGLGDVMVEQLVATELVDSIPSIYALTLEALLSLERVWEKKSATNLLEAIARAVSVVRFGGYYSA